MLDESIKLKMNAPRIEIALGSLSKARSGSGTYVAVAMLHTSDGEALYQPLIPAILDTDAAANLLAEIYDYICQRWAPTK